MWDVVGAVRRNCWAEIRLRLSQDFLTEPLQIECLTCKTAIHINGDSFREAGGFHEHITSMFILEELQSDMEAASTQHGCLSDKSNVLR